MHRVLTLTLAALLCGCSTLGIKPGNVPLEHYDPSYGYRANDPSKHRESGYLTITLAFSGGGTRAAAFAYGVMEELHDTKVIVHGKQTTLLAEVDTISGVSGGSFPAAYYGLFGNRIFEEFEERFLKKNVQRRLVLQFFYPKNLLLLFTPRLSRSELASSYYDKHVFDRATFADLIEAKGPRIYINATDLSSGFRFTYTQGQFDVICSDLSKFPISRAVASSAAVPMLLSPITLINHAGTCGFERPDWAEDALAARDDPRRHRAAESFFHFQGTDGKKYIHLIDGGISDNLGVSPFLDAIAAAGGMEKLAEIYGIRELDHLVVISVNAETDPSPTIDLSQTAPGLAQLMNAVSGAQIRHANFETLVQARNAVERAVRDLSTPEKPVEGHFIEVAFDGIQDPARRRYYKLMKTSFTLTDAEVDDLRAAGRRLLRDNKAFQELIQKLQ